MRSRLLMLAATILFLPISPSSRVQAGDDGEAARPSDTISGGSMVAYSAPSPGAISAEPVAADSARIRLLTPYWHYRPATSTMLTFRSRPSDKPWGISGFESYRASRAECAFQGAAIGSTIGMNIAALGLMTGKLDQKEGWIIGGAMTTLGIIYGGIFKADDPKWYDRIRIGVSSGK